MDGPISSKKNEAEEAGVLNEAGHIGGAWKI
jgi:hypothetical protein